MAEEVPTTQKAVYYEEQGPSAEVCKFRADAPVRAECAEGEALLKVHAAGINPVDNMITMGLLKRTGVIYYQEGQRAIGSDVSGVIVKVGAGAVVVTGLDEQGAKITKPAEVGDVVFGCCRQSYGAFAEYALVDSSQLVVKPPEVTHVDAAAMPLAAMTAYAALTQHSQVKEGDKVLILGGSSAVGICAIQIAKALGASRVAATGTDAEFIMSVGADEVVNYRVEDWGQRFDKQDFDVVFAAVMDKNPSPAWRRAIDVTKAGGSYVALMTSSFPADDQATDLTLSAFDEKTLVKAWTTKSEQRLVSTGLTFTWNTPYLLKSLDLVLTGKMRIPLHNQAAYDFTEEGWKALHEVNTSARAKGKLVFDLKVGV